MDDATFVMAVTSFSVMVANSFTSAEFVVASLATVVQSSVVAVTRLDIVLMVSMFSLAWADVGAGAT